MKKTIVIFSFFWVSLLPVLSVADVQVESDEQKYSYALGTEYMKSLKKDDTPLDALAFLQGLMDVQAGRQLRLDAAEARRAMDYFVAQTVLRRQAKAAQTLADGQAFLEKNARRSGVKVLPGGLQYKVMVGGAGERKPTLEDGVAVRYRLADLAGKELLRSDPSGAPKQLLVKALISGWKEALLLMKEGDKWQLFLPPNLAYGENGSPDGTISPNQTLIYELELVSVVSADEARAAMDKPTISKVTQTSFQ